MSDSVDPDETPCSVASHLGLHCLLRLVCPYTYGKYGTVFTIKMPFKFVAGNNLYLFHGNKTRHFMQIACLTDDGLPIR